LRIETRKEEEEEEERLYLHLETRERVYGDRRSGLLSAKLRHGPSPKNRFRSPSIPSVATALPNKAHPQSKKTIRIDQN
jgi:hypothetical protein